MKDINLGSNGELLPEKTGRIALIDADTVAFNAALGSEEVEYVGNDEIYHANVELGIEYAKNKIQEILDKTGCEEAELHFSSGKEHFRYQIFPEYKANRKTNRYPEGLAEIKQALGGTVHTKIEADDAVVYLKRAYPDKYTLVAVDKDVLNAVAGKHFNYYVSDKYGIPMKWVDITEAHARFWPYLQSILGDKNDGIEGAKGIGEKKALKYISPDMTDGELWEGVVAAFEKTGKTADDALLVMNLVNMTVYNGKEVIKWLPSEI